MASMITNTAIRAPPDTPGTSRKLCQSQNSADVDIWVIHSTGM